MIPQFYLLAVLAIALPAAFIVVLPRRWLILALLAWTASPLAAFVAVVAWEALTRPDVSHSFEDVLLGFSLISAIFIIPWTIICALGFSIGFALRRLIRGRQPGDTPSADHGAPPFVAPTAFQTAAAAADAPPGFEAALPIAARDRSSDTDAWRQAHIGFEMDDLKIGGLGVWSNAWRSVGTPPLRLPHPAYPEQLHDYTVQEIAEGSTLVRFAVSELSNGVWGFYVPRHPALDTSAFSIDRSLRYEQRHGERGAGQPDTERSWAVLSDAATGRALVDCAAWPESRITGNADGSLFLRLKQEDGETLFRIDPTVWMFRNQGENGTNWPLLELADTVEQLRRAPTLGPAGPQYRHISPDGTIRVDSEAVEWGNSHWVYTPRVTDIASGRVVLDLWGTDWDATIAWPGNRRVSLDFRRYHFSGDLTIELDLENDIYRIVREPGATAELPSGPLSEAADAMEASGRRVAAWAAKHNASRPVRDTLGKPHPFAAWRTALVILLVAVILIAVATTLSMNTGPLRDPDADPALLRPIPEPDLSSSDRMRAAVVTVNSTMEAPVR